jgi:Fe-S-cluster-containing dehydrogenase component
MAVKDRVEDGFAFSKKSCLHCVDPSCVSACPVSAMKKDPSTGLVSYDVDACIGCRYCVAACPFGVPRFTYDSPTPQDQQVPAVPAPLARGQVRGLRRGLPDRRHAVREGQRA